ncbi:GlcG/HbpS family heme-binding protein [Crenalkalicoccus roseus]|uniref:GlcG/HbpS family heme-binding protein n=1 Tax=Crenalkalicoccus roseus TaxID=1485588 RepID=UPI001080CC2A|nr:heme-binding protein [Crenalkalicoccus roseus]
MPDQTAPRSAVNGLTLAQANAILEAALAKGRALNLLPLTVAVLDAGGQLKALQREDGSSLLRPEIAIGKAYGALALGLGGRELARRAQAMAGFMNALSDLAGGRAVPVPGGVLACDAAGVILGAVGISGDVSAQDEVCAIAGIEAAGLRAETGDPG